MKKLIYLFAIILLTNCTVHRFETLDRFDFPELDYRDFDKNVLAYYEPDYNKIWDSWNNFTFTADTIVASQLKTKDTFSVRPPFTVKFKARMFKANYALIAPVWLMRLSDAGGRIVREIDCVELAGEDLFLTAHYSNSGYENTEVFQQQIWSNAHTWNKYEVRVENDRIRWYVNGNLKHEVNKYFGKEPYYIWCSIIMSLDYKNDSLPNEARMDLRGLKVIKKW